MEIGHNLMPEVWRLEAGEIHTLKAGCLQNQGKAVIVYD